MKRDVVFALGENVKRDELTYALRSLRFLPHRNVYFLGGAPPDWVQNVYHLPFKTGHKWRNLDDKFRSLRYIGVLTDEIIYTEDDYFVLEPQFDLPNYWHVTMAERVRREDAKGAKGAWSKPLRDTKELLPPKALSFDVHIPMVVERQLIDNTIPDTHPLRWRSIIGNASDRRRVQIPLDAKARNKEELQAILDAGLPFLSSSDVTFKRSGIKAYLETIHPDPCRYETEYKP